LKWTDVLLWALPGIQVQCIDGGFSAGCCATVVAALLPNAVIPDYLTMHGFAEEIQMIAFYLSLIALGAGGVAVIRELAATQAKQRPARIPTGDRRMSRNARRG
jgi:hypothetical protein